ncbi:MFS transporter [Micromonospora sp. GCM10011542]|uniref:MFS transporter n=1 Tax=Micromonospora sp. GCM10011542 TaxID=3317337 RepID=UPI00360EB4A0
MDTDRPTEDGPALRLGSGRGRWLLTATVLGSALAQLEATVVNVALPVIGRELDADVSGLQWVLNGYLLTLAALILLGGSLGDRLGRRRIFVLGAVVFTIASGACAIAPTLPVLVAARVVQGIGGALLTPGSLAMLEALLRREDRAKAIGAWSALGGVAAAAGPLISGWLVESSWRWVFVLPIPLGVLVVLISLARVPESRDPGAHGRIDITGAALATLALAGLTFALVQASGGFGLPVVLAALVGLAAGAAFVLRERRIDNPMLPPDIFADRQFTAANAVTFVVYAALGGVFFLFVVFLQGALGYTPLQAGAASLPITVLMLALSSASGALAQRIGPRIPLTVGPLLLAAGMLLMLRIGPGSHYLPDVLPAVVVFGLGLAGVVAPVTSTVLAAASDRHSGSASGVNNAVARTAQLTAIAVLPLAVGLTGSQYTQPDALTDAFHRAMLLTAALGVLGALIAVTTIRSDVLAQVGQGTGRGREGRYRMRNLRHHLHLGVAGPPARTATPEQPGAGGEEPGGRP